MGLIEEENIKSYWTRVF